MSEINEVKEKRKYNRKSRIQVITEEGNEVDELLAQEEVKAEIIEEQPVKEVEEVAAVKERAKNCVVSFKYGPNEKVFYIDFGLISNSNNFGKINKRFEYFIKNGEIQKLIFDGDIKYLINGVEKKECFVFKNEKLAEEAKNSLNNGK